MKEEKKSLHFSRDGIFYALKRRRKKKEKRKKTIAFLYPLKGHWLVKILKEGWNLTPVSEKNEKKSCYYMWEKVYILGKNGIKIFLNEKKVLMTKAIT